MFGPLSPGIQGYEVKIVDVGFHTKRRGASTTSARSSMLMLSVEQPVAAVSASFNGSSRCEAVVGINSVKAKSKSRTIGRQGKGKATPSITA
ncbi:MAG: hypothetical protein H7346_12345 [Burkholderiaceae bacterium]|nr:hypothetical protein [Burkholderiaceae bacterium]